VVEKKKKKFTDIAIYSFYDHHCKKPKNQNKKQSMLDENEGIKSAKKNTPHVMCVLPLLSQSNQNKNSVDILIHRQSHVTDFSLSTSNAYVNTTCMFLISLCHVGKPHLTHSLDSTNSKRTILTI